MGDGKKRAQAEAQARVADAARLRMNATATALGYEIQRLRRLVTINRILCVAALTVAAWLMLR